MSNIDNILRAAMIAAAVVNLISCVHYVIRLRKSDELTEAMKLWLTEDPRYNYLVQVLEKHPDGMAKQGEVLEGYVRWLKETKPDLPLKMLNANAILNGMLNHMGQTEEDTPPDESGGHSAETRLRARRGKPQSTI